MKKKEGRRVKEYKRVTLMVTLYKIYTTILQDRLREEVESKGIITAN